MLLDWHKDRADLPGMRLVDTQATGIDEQKMFRDRLAKVRAEMAKCDMAACILFDPVNVRYATGARNMQIFMARNPARYVFIPQEGPVVLFEFEGCHHLARHLTTIDEIRPAVTVSFVAAGSALSIAEQRWAEQIAELAGQYGGKGCRLGVERVNVRAAQALAEKGFNIVDAQEPVERARAIKTPEELICIQQSLDATVNGVHLLRNAIEPGITENELWSILHQAVIAQDGDYVETRLLNSGERSNPWFQETSPKKIQAGELVALDTDVVGCHGYYADFSRTFLCGDQAPTEEQKTHYKLAYEQVYTNMDLIKPGLTFDEYSRMAWKIPERYFKNRYYLLAHGVGMTGEYPYIFHEHDIPDDGYEGTIEPGMTLCVESYIGAEDGTVGVKLEEQVLVTETGIELMSHFPFEEDLLAD